MPELPEVEVTRLSFASRIEGAKVLSARKGKPLRWPLGCEVEDLTGLTVMAVRRRGKYLLLDLEQASPITPNMDAHAGLLLLHLGMSGSLHFRESELDGLQRARDKHDHFELHTTQGTLWLNDPRRFGAVVFAPSEQSSVAQKLLGKLGVEPLSDAFNDSEFHQGLKQRSAAIKQVLLAGEVVVGVGNIYASEALFMAGIRPTLSAVRISLPRARRLATAIREVLTKAIELGGSTLQNFKSAKGESGYFQLKAHVYGRAGLPCDVCQTSIKKIVQGQRSTFYCPTCQK